MMNDRTTAGPAFCAATCPVSTKMPVPMIAPMPSVVRFRAPSTRFRLLSVVASVCSAVMLLRRNRFMRAPAVWWDGVEAAAKGGTSVYNRSRAKLAAAATVCQDARYARPSNGIVGCFPGDGDVVGMRLAQSGRRDAHEFRFGAKGVDRPAAHVAHSAAQASNHLKEHVEHRPAIRNASLDAFRYEFLRRQ